MKKVLFLFLLVFKISISQEIKQNKIIDLEPSMRVGIIKPLHFGNNIISKEFNNSIGFTGNFSFIKIFDLKLSVGFDFQKYNEKNSSIGNISHINKFSYTLQSDYSIDLNSKYAIIPFIHYAFTNINFKNSSSILAKQNGNEIKVGSYLDYKMNNTYSLFIGFNYCKFINNINATKQNKSYYGASNAIQITLGIELN